MSYKLIKCAVKVKSKTIKYIYEGDIQTFKKKTNYFRLSKFSIVTFPPLKVLQVD